MLVFILASGARIIAGTRESYARDEPLTVWRLSLT
mgnify:CR=1 FL=1|jgi:hypothetical protein